MATLQSTDLSADVCLLYRQLVCCTDLQSGGSRHPISFSTVHTTLNVHCSVLRLRCVCACLLTVGFCSHHRSYYEAGAAEHLCGSHLPVVVSDNEQEKLQGNSPTKPMAGRWSPAIGGGLYFSPTYFRRALSLTCTLIDHSTVLYNRDTTQQPY